VKIEEVQVKHGLHPELIRIVHLVEESTGKPIAFQPKNDLQVSALTKIARERMPEHIIRFHPSRTDRLSHLIAHECGHILRMMRAKPEDRLVPVTGPSELAAAQKAISREVNVLPLPPQMLQRMFTVWVHGLTLQVTNLSVDVYIEKWLHHGFPALQAEQARSLEKEAETSLQALSKQVEQHTPLTVFRASNAMNYAYLREIGPLAGHDYLDGYVRYPPILRMGKALHGMLESEDRGVATDQQIINKWAEYLHINTWFTWLPFEAMPESYFRE
jgi:hypothetical protein